MVQKIQRQKSLGDFLNKTVIFQVDDQFLIFLFHLLKNMVYQSSLNVYLRKTEQILHLQQLFEQKFLPY